jgi:hypothetical protein
MYCHLTRCGFALHVAVASDSGPVGAGDFRSRPLAMLVSWVAVDRGYSGGRRWDRLAHATLRVSISLVGLSSGFSGACRPCTAFQRTSPMERALFSMPWPRAGAVVAARERDRNRGTWEPFYPLSSTADHLISSPAIYCHGRVSACIGVHRRASALTGDHPGRRLGWTLDSQ